MHRDETDKGTVSKIHDFYYVDGKRIGDVGSDGPTRVDYVKSLARDRNAKPNYKNYKPISSADFDQNYDSLDLSENLPTARNRPTNWLGMTTTPYSEALRDIDDPGVARTLDAVDGNFLLDDGAGNWADYDDRMDFIAELFRTRQDDARLHNAPFTEEQKQQRLRELGR